MTIVTMVRTHTKAGRLRARSVASSANATIKVYRRALAEGVTANGWLAIEGFRLLEEALKNVENSSPPSCRCSSPRIHSVMVAKGAAEKAFPLLAHLPGEAEVVEVPDRLFASLSQTQSPQGIAALVELPSRSLDTLLSLPGALLVVACGMQDPGNLGTILRSAEAMGASGVLALKSTVCLFNPKVVRSSGGAIFRLPVLPGLQAEALLAQLHRAEFRVIAADQRGAIILHEADLRGRIAFLIGQESAGLPECLRSAATSIVRIPIRLGVNSLNAAAAAAICLYEAARQRGIP